MWGSGSPLDIIMSSSPSLYKVIILGDNKVGKTTLFHRILFGTYLDTTNEYDAGITTRSTGLDCFEKTFNVLGQDMRVYQAHIYSLYAINIHLSDTTQ